MSIAKTVRGVCFASNCMHLLWAACKVLLSGMQINYAMLHDTNTPCITSPTVFELSKDPKVLHGISHKNAFF